MMPWFLLPRDTIAPSHGGRQIEDVWDWIKLVFIVLLCLALEAFCKVPWEEGNDV